MYELNTFGSRLLGKLAQSNHQLLHAGHYLCLTYQVWWQLCALYLRKELRVVRRTTKSVQTFRMWHVVQERPSVQQQARCDVLVHPRLALLTHVQQAQLRSRTFASVQIDALATETATRRVIY